MIRPKPYIAVAEKNIAAKNNLYFLSKIPF
jgi:hypothetical protein